jgi:hypothetical protein
MILRRLSSLLLLFATLLLLSIGLGDAADRKSCRTISNRAQLTKLISNAHVLVSIQTDDDLGDDDADYKELCDRFSSTPVERVQELDIIRVTDEELAKQLWENHSFVHWFDQVQSTLRTVQQAVWRKAADDEKASDDNDDSVRYILFQKGAPESGRRYVGSSLSADAVSEFLATVTKTKKLGNFVYSMHHFDFCAAQFVRATSDQVPWKQTAWYTAARVLSALPFQMSSDATGTSQTLAALYLKAMKNIQTHGMHYAQQQIQRLDKLLDDGDAKISELKREELSQKKYILQRFTEPVDLDSAEIQQFLWYIWGNGGLLLLFLLLWLPLSMLFPDAAEEEKEDENDREEEDEVAAASKKKDE